MIYLYNDWAIIAAFVFVYSLIAEAMERTWISDAIVFVVFGFLFGPYGLGILQFNVNSENLRLIAELTLALVLFTDAANANLAVLKSSVRLPIRLLLVGLPLTILVGFGFGWLLFKDFSLVEAAILATMLAPTDAALGKAVVTNPNVPATIREDLNVESGLNDGICVPVLFVLLAIATHQNTESSISQLVFQLFTEEIGIGVLVGASLVVLGMQLGKFAIKGNWISETWRQVSVPSLAIACFATAQSLGGSGFIASFVGGLVFGVLAKRHKEDLLRISEATGDTISLVTWVAFGSAVVGLTISKLTWPILLYAILSLTLIRIVPIVLCLSGIGLDLESKLFVGWFGPRGLASIVFAVIVLGEKLPNSETLVITVTCTVLLSILAHGLTANPWVKRYSQRLQRSIGSPNSQSS